MKQFLQQYILRNRYTLLATVIAVYVLVLVVEGAITGREASLIDFENPFFDLEINNFEELNRDR